MLDRPQRRYKLMARHIACLTFDFDAVSGVISEGLRTPTPISRGEFGVVGAARILGILERHGIKSTWFIPGHTLETYPEMSEKSSLRGMKSAITAGPT